MTEITEILDCIEAGNPLLKCPTLKSIVRFTIDSEAALAKNGPLPTFSTPAERAIITFSKLG